MAHENRLQLRAPYLYFTPNIEIARKKPKKEVITMKKIFIMILVSLAMYGCRYYRQPLKDFASEAAVVKIPNFKPSSSYKKWSKGSLLIRNMEGKIQHTFNLQANIESVSTLNLNHGDYRFELTYYDEDNAILYSTCDEDQKIVHHISNSNYSFKSKICLPGSNTPIGAADEGIGEGGTSGKFPEVKVKTLNGVWKHCESREQENISFLKTYAIDLDGKTILLEIFQHENLDCQSQNQNNPTGASVFRLSSEITSLVEGDLIKIVFANPQRSLSSLYLTKNNDKIMIFKECTIEPSSNQENCVDINVIYRRSN